MARSLRVPWRWPQRLLGPEIKSLLVVGNGAYSEITKLDNPPRDANLIASKLRLLDFDVLEIIDADRIEMEQALREFGRRATDADAAVFFYAGHGIQDSGRNYLLPVSAELEHRGDLRYETLELSKVMEELELAAARGKRRHSRCLSRQSAKRHDRRDLSDAVAGAKPRPGHSAWRDRNAHRLCDSAG